MQRFRLGLAAIVTTVWLVGYALAYANGANPPNEVTGLMAIVLGWAFAGQIKDNVNQRRDRDRNEKRD